MVFVLISSESRYPVDREKIRQRIEDLVRGVGLEDVEVSIAVVGSRKIKNLNREFRQTDEVTDVLAFPLQEARGPDGILRLGDIVVCYPVARSQAAKEEKMVDEKIGELVEHGIKHLLGEEHE